MNLFITGATGLIGQHFIERYPQYRYTILSRSKKKASEIFGNKVDAVSTLEELQNLNEFDAVINLAGEPIIGQRWTQEKKAVIEQSRWNTTKQLVNLIKASSTPPDVFLSGSAIGVYGDTGDELVDESANADPLDFPSKLCLNWEKIALEAEMDTRVILQRTGIVLSDQGGALAKMLLPFKLNLGGKLGSGEQYMSWIHIADITDAMNFVLQHQECRGPVNMVTPNNLTNLEFSKTLADVLRRRALLPVPERMLKLAFGEAAQILLDSQRVAPSILESAGFSFTFPEFRPAIVNLLAKQQY